MGVRKHNAQQGRVRSKDDKPIKRRAEQTIAEDQKKVDKYGGDMQPWEYDPDKVAIRTKKSREGYIISETKLDENAAIIGNAIVSLDLPPVDLTNEEQIGDRLREYLEFCQNTGKMPHIVGMANWMGINKENLSAWKRGEYVTPARKEVIDRIMGVFEEILVDYFQQNKINVAAGIFLLKNMFGYKDQQDVVITPNNPLGEAATNSDLAAKYIDVDAEVVE